MNQAEQIIEAPTTRDLQREETRRRVRDAAMRVFRRDGFVAARIDDIVKLAGVSRGTFYFHFPTKEDVLVELLEEAEDRVAADVSALSGSLTPKKVLSTFCASFAGEWEGKRDVFPHVGTVAVLHSAATLQQGARKNPVRGALAEHFRGAVKRRELTTSLPPVVLADIFLMNAFAATLAWCGQPKSLSLELVLRTVADIFLNGARPRASKR